MSEINDNIILIFPKLCVAMVLRDTSSLLCLFVGIEFLGITPIKILGYHKFSQILTYLILFWEVSLAD